jgi:hypothetical protein
MERGPAPPVMGDGENEYCSCQDTWIDVMGYYNRKQVDYGRVCGVFPSRCVRANRKRGGKMVFAKANGCHPLEIQQTQPVTSLMHSLTRRSPSQGEKGV